MEEYSYREFAFHLADSLAYGRFCRIGFGKSFKPSALQRGIKSISDTIWEQINKVLVGYAREEAIKKRSRNNPSFPRSRNEDLFIYIIPAKGEIRNSRCFSLRHFNRQV